MKYSLRFILNTRRTLDQSAERKIANRLVVLSAITKFLSPVPTWIFLNVGIKPDWVTFVSIFALIIGAFLFIMGQVIGGVVAILCFALFDSVDGDMARCMPSTSYGATLDSFGADFFYGLIPPALGYYLYSISTTVGPLMPEHLFLISAFVSITLLLYRLIKTKHLGLLLSGRHVKGNIEEYKMTPSNPYGWSSLLKKTLFRLMKLYRSTIFRNNFFAEPGMLLFFSIFSLLGMWEALGMYLIILLIYNVGFLAQNVAHAYLSFLAYENRKL